MCRQNMVECYTFFTLTCAQYGNGNGNGNVLSHVMHIIFESVLLRAERCKSMNSLFLVIYFLVRYFHLSVSVCVCIWHKNDVLSYHIISPLFQHSNIERRPFVAQFVLPFCLFNVHHHGEICKHFRSVYAIVFVSQIARERLLLCIATICGRNHHNQIIFFNQINEHAKSEH